MIADRCCSARTWAACLLASQFGINKVGVTAKKVSRPG